MAKTAASKKQKGSRLERKVAEALRRTGLDPNAGRMPLSGADSHLKGDVRTDLPYTIECKNTERVRLWDFWGQATDQAHYHPPVLCISANHRPVLAVVELETLLNLMQCEQQLDGAIQETETAGGASKTSAPKRKQGKWKRKPDGTVVPRETET